MSNPTTLLVLSVAGVPPYSARGIHHTLEPIDRIKGATILRRTVNGQLLDLSPHQMRKFKTSITCADQQPPAFNGIWNGMQIVVDCVAELSYATAGGSPDRIVVDGSSRVEGDFTFYRPRLTMLVADFSISKAEYDAETSWKLDLEEV